ncbi:vestitone reductase-like [Actinidia eriantha]|uniref:vestitone reductase-like n=1 Tax=Actinidia eriantha TaxID=165200 RepID=UPI0025855626|nr:vestitone reductase-like [Actinidia eriantha]
MAGDKGLVCVTGGTGYIASWLIMKLLQNGYHVRATVRPGTVYKKDISYLTNLPGAAEKLHIVDADLNRPESFQAAISGCSDVFHVAHPMDLTGVEPAEVVIKRAVEGTVGILKACLNTKTVKRVVLTSSTATVLSNSQDQHATDESTWSDVDFFKGSSYIVSKTKTERAALEFAEKHGLDLVTLIPSLVLGPFLCPNLPSSVEMGLAMILRKEEMYKFLMNSSLVHIDDVVSAHIFLFEHPNAEGRYICSSNEITMHRMSEFLAAKYPEFQIPTADILDKVEGHKVSGASSKKLLDSGFRFKYGLDEMFDGGIQCCKEKGFL